MDDQEKQERVDHAVGQIRGLFNAPPMDDRDDLRAGTLIRIKLKDGVVHTFERTPNGIGTARLVWHSFIYEPKSWPDLVKWLQRKTNHVEWVRMVDSDTLSTTQIYPEPDPEELEDEEEDWETVQVDGVLYQASFYKRSLGQFGTLRDAKDRITDRFETELAWDRENAFTWRPSNDGLDGYMITRTKRGRRE